MTDSTDDELPARTHHDDEDSDELTLYDLYAWTNTWGEGGGKGGRQYITDTTVFLHPDVDPAWFRDESPARDVNEILEENGIDRPANVLIGEIRDD